MLDSFVQGFLIYIDLYRFSFLMLGVLLGVFIGLIPALGGIVAMALLLPFVFSMDKIAGLSMLVAIHAISGTGDNITSILMGIPGGGPSIITLLDGFTMTKKGEPGRALGIMICADTMGAVLGVFLAVLMIPFIKPLVMAFGYPELFFLILMGLSFLAILSRGSSVKGLMAGFTGILLALVGYQDSTGIDRFAFGYDVLLGGFTIISVVLGLFAGAEMLEMAVFKQTIATSSVIRVGKEVRQQFFRGMREVFHHKWLWFRSCLLGYVMGLIPGIGAPVAVWVSYGQAKQTSKHPELFGTGYVEGIIAPESTMNAKEGASLLTSLCLGLPNGITMAILLAALLLQGVIPGPSMLKNDLTLTFTLLWGLAISNVIGAVVCYFIIGYLNLISLITLPPRVLVPTILSIIYLGSYTTENHVSAIGITIAFSVIGLVMKRQEYSRAAMILGFILGEFFESYFFLALQTAGPFFFLRPVSLGIVAVMIGVYVYQPILSFIRLRNGESSPAVRNAANKFSTTGNVSIPITVAAVMTAVVTIASGFPYLQAKLTILFSSGLVLVLALMQIMKELNHKKQQIGKLALERNKFKHNTNGMLYVFEGAWMIGFGMAIYFLGFILSTTLFICTYMKSHGTPLPASIITGVLMSACCYGIFTLVLDLELYRGIVFMRMGL